MCSQRNIEMHAKNPLQLEGALQASSKHPGSEVGLQVPSLPPCGRCQIHHGKGSGQTAAGRSSGNGCWAVPITQTSAVCVQSEQPSRGRTLVNRHEDGRSQVLASHVLHVSLACLTARLHSHSRETDRKLDMRCTMSEAWA